MTVRRSRPLTPGLSPPVAIPLPVPRPRRLPADLRQLVEVAVAQGPTLLQGQPPERVGLRLTHPRAPSCPAEQTAQGAAVVEVLPLEVLQAAEPSLSTSPGRCPVLLVGAKWTATMQVAPLPSARRRVAARSGLARACSRC